MRQVEVRHETASSKSESALDAFGIHWIEKIKCLLSGQFDTVFFLLEDKRNGLNLRSYMSGSRSEQAVQAWDLLRPRMSRELIVRIFNVTSKEIPINRDLFEKAYNELP